MSSTARQPEPDPGEGRESPFLRVSGDFPSTPFRGSALRKSGAATLRSVPGGRPEPSGAGHPAASPSPVSDPCTPRRPEESAAPARPRAPGIFGASLPHWTLLFAALGFAVGVQVYVQRTGHAAKASGSEVPLLVAQGPDSPVAASDLWLRWEEVDGADCYLLRITSAVGDPVVDPMPEYGTVWNPPDELLPGFSRGTYFFQVEAQDPAGTILARSIPAPMEILR